MGRRIWQMVKKEFIQVWRDRRLRIFLILPPIIQLIIYGYAINFDIRQVPFAVFDEDRTQASEFLISRFTCVGIFQPDRFHQQRRGTAEPDRPQPDYPGGAHPQGFCRKNQGQPAGRRCNSSWTPRIPTPP